jgi:nitroreductase
LRGAARKAVFRSARHVPLPADYSTTGGVMIDLLRSRRSIRKFTPEPVSAESIEIITEAALRSPTSRGINPWEFIVVDEPELLASLSRAKEHGSEFLKGAPLAVVVCADSSKSDVWVEDCSIAAIIIQLTALSLGLGSCWAQIRQRRHDREFSAESYLRQLLGLPEHIVVEAVIGIGHPAEKKRPLAAGALQREKVRINRWE